MQAHAGSYEDTAIPASDLFQNGCSVCSYEGTFKESGGEKNPERVSISEK